MTESVKTNIFGHVLEVTLDRPKANAIDLKTSKVMGDIFCDFRDNPNLESCNNYWRRRKIFLCRLGFKSCCRWRCS